MIDRRVEEMTRNGIVEPASLIDNQGRRGYGDSHGDGYGYGMGMGTVMNPHGSMGIMWGILNGCEIKRKRVKYAINVIVVV